MNRLKIISISVIAAICLHQPDSKAQKRDVCNGPGFHKTIEELSRIEDPNAAQLVSLSTAYQALGNANRAEFYAQKAIYADRSSGAANIAKVHALHLAGKMADALELAQVVYKDEKQLYYFDRGEKSWLRHTIYSLLLQDGKADQVEQLILDEFPRTLDLIEKEPVSLSLSFGVPLHTLETLIHIYRERGDNERVVGLSKHLRGFSAESFFESTDAALQGSQNWMLASIWAGNLDQRVVPALQMAYGKGFMLGWRFNYPNHPVYWPYRDNDDFKALIATIEQDMMAQALCLD